MDNTSVIIGFILFGIVIFLLVIIFNSLKEKQQPKWKKDVIKTLNQVLKTKSEIKYQIIELDKLLEYTLKQVYHIDDSLGGILKKKRNSFEREELNKIWEAHKLRNKLVHDVNFDASNKKYFFAKSVLTKSIKKFIN